MRRYDLKLNIRRTVAFFLVLISPFALLPRLMPTGSAAIAERASSGRFPPERS